MRNSATGLRGCGVVVDGFLKKFQRASLPKRCEGHLFQPLVPLSLVVVVHWCAEFEFVSCNRVKNDVDVAGRTESGGSFSLMGPLAKVVSKVFIHIATPLVVSPRFFTSTKPAVPFPCRTLNPQIKSIDSMRSVLVPRGPHCTVEGGRDRSEKSVLSWNLG